MKPSDFGDVTFDSDFETELELAIQDAEDYGIAFFVVFEDGTMGRSTIAEVSEIVDVWKKKTALS